MASSANRWTLDEESLSILLAALAPDRDAACRRYEALRRRLIDVFAWERSETPEDAADEALNRLARRLASGVAIEDQNIERYAFGIARYVMLEEARGRRARDAALAEFRVLQAKPGEPVLLRRLERCLEALPSDQRDLDPPLLLGESRPAGDGARDLGQRAAESRAPDPRAPLRVRDARRS